MEIHQLIVLDRPPCLCVGLPECFCNAHAVHGHLFDTVILFGRLYAKHIENCRGNIGHMNILSPNLSLVCDTCRPVYYERGSCSAGVCAVLVVLKWSIACLPPPPRVYSLQFRPAQFVYSPEEFVHVDFGPVETGGKTEPSVRSSIAGTPIVA